MGFPLSARKRTKANGEVHTRGSTTTQRELAGSYPATYNLLLEEKKVVIFLNISGNGFLPKKIYSY